MRSNNTTYVTLMAVLFLVLTSFFTFDFKSFDWKFFVLILFPLIFSVVFLNKYIYDLAKKNTKVFNAKYKLFYSFKEKEQKLDIIEQKFLDNQNCKIINEIYIIYYFI